MKTVTFPRVFPQLPPLPKKVKIPLLLLVGVLVFALPILNPPILSTPDSDFGSVLFDSAIGLTGVTIIFFRKRPTSVSIETLLRSCT